MRRSRTIFCLGVLLAFLIPLRSTLASAAAEPFTTDSTAPPESTLTIYLVKGPGFEAVYVSYWSMDSFRYRTPSGETGYLTANKIRSIKDAEGIDRLDSMLRRRSSFGVPSPEENRSFASWVMRPFHSTPERRRRSYLVLEFGIGSRAGGTTNTGRSSTLLTTGIGGMKNLSPRWGLGGVVQFMESSEEYRTLSAGVRVRRYLSDWIAIETTQGLYQNIDTATRKERGVPYFGEVAISAAGAASFFTRLERHQYTVSRYTVSFYPDNYTVSETTLHFGIRLGPNPGYLTGPLVALGTLAVLAPRGRNIY